MVPYFADIYCVITVALTREQFHMKCLRYPSFLWVQKLPIFRSLNTTNLRLQPYLRGANELRQPNVNT